MGKIKRFQIKKSIKTAFACYMLIGILLAIFLSLFFSGVCESVKEQICEKYEYEIQYGNLNIQLEMLPENLIIGHYAGDITTFFRPNDKRLYDVVSFFSMLVFPVCFIFCIAATSILFYKQQLQKPLSILDYAASKIAKNNLDFKVIYKKEDEMGNLCASFEKMRQALQENNEEMWRQMEERKRLNVAFSHDLRTPLTVLKGQSELLMQYAPKMSIEKVRKTSEMMYRHIIRLEEYVQVMGEMQRLEDIEVVRQPITLGGLYKQLREIGEVICSQKSFSFEAAGEPYIILKIDSSIVLRVFENLLANAVRFAKEKIIVSAEVQDGYFYLAVSDDGNGFIEKELENVTKPFYKTVKETDKEHFGMGLNICKILCEKHGGYIHVKNKNGAVVSVAFKQ